MMNFEGTEIRLISVDMDINSDTFCCHLRTPATTVVFESDNSNSLDDLLQQSGFERFKHLGKIYFQPFDELILIIKTYDNHVKEKYWIKNTESNINFIHKADLNYGSSFQSYYSDAAQQYNLYPESIEVPFFENFQIRNVDTSILTRVDVGFKYAPNQYVIASIFEKYKKTIHICYDDYNDESKKIYPDFIEFEGNQLSVVQMLNRATNNKISLLEENIFDSTHINLTNFHLFWERLTPQEKTLLDILLI